MDIRAGSPSDAEAVTDLIASFQSELTDDPSGAGAESFLASVSVMPSANTWLRRAIGTFWLSLALSSPASSPYETVPIYFTCSSGAHINAKVLVGVCGSRLYGSCALRTAKASSRSTQAFPQSRSIAGSALFQLVQRRASMAFRFFPCGAQPRYHDTPYGFHTTYSN